ncbi:C2 domain-containing protein [Ceratobasidium sp. AG-Ba]|nr:C2 domain-containing protein [Ceratobasidium sp. AG-Ba]
MSVPSAKDVAAASAQAHSELNGIQHEDAAKGAVVHTFDPNMSPEEKAAAAGKARSGLESIKAQERKEEARELAVDVGGPPVAPTITIEDVDKTTKEVLEESNTQNGQPMPGTMPAGAAPAIPDWYKVGWRAHAGIDDPTPTAEEIDKGVIETFLSEMYYGEWYHNAAIIFFAVAASHYMTLFRLGWGWLFILLAICATYYKSSMERVRRRARDDIQRELVKTKLEQDYESAHWMNNFMDRFWLIYEPVLSASIVATVDQILSASTPAFLDSIRLENFTLGTKAPRIDRVYTSPRTDKDIVQMDWGFSFTPNDLSHMTHREAQQKVNPKIVLAVRVGKGLATAAMPILLEDMSFSGVMRVKLKLMANFPHVQTVGISFMQPPTFDYVLKPLGGDTFGFDIGNIPGLSSFIRDTVHSILGPMMYDPNVFTLNLEQMLSGAPLDAAIGVLQVTIFDARGLKSTKLGGGTPDPYVSLTINNRAEMARTKYKASTYNPHWGEVKFILINSLTETLNLTILDHNDHRKDSDLGTASFELSALNDDATQEGLVRKVLKDGKERGEIKFDVAFFPVLKPKTLDGGKIQPLPETKVGIVRLVVHQAKDLDASKSMSGDLNPFAKVLLRSHPVHTTTVMKHTLSPVWESPTEFLVTDKSSSVVTLKIIDDRDFLKDPVVGYMNIRLKDLLEAREKQQDWFPLSGCKSGKVRLSADWKPLNMAGSMQGADSYSPPIGIIRLWIKRAKDVKNVEASLGGKSDPYVRVMLNAVTMARTEVKNNNLNPEWDQIVYVPVHSLRETLYLECMDYQHLTKDRSLGFVELSVAKLAEPRDDIRMPFAGTGKCDIADPIRLDKNTFKGELHYTAEFIPAVALRGIAFQGADDIQRAIERAKGGHEDEDGVASGDESSVSSSDEEIQKVPHDITVNAKGHRVTRHKVAKSVDTAVTGQTGQTESTEDLVDQLEDENKDAAAHGPGVEMTTEEVLQHQSGIMVFNIIDGQIAKKAKLEVLLDDGYWPVFITEKARSTQAHWDQVGEGFVKELDFGRVWLRLNEDDGEKEDIIAEYKTDAKAFLEQTLAGPTTFTLVDQDGRNRSTIKIQAKYVPVEIKLDPRESINNMGVLRVELLDGRDLAAADRSGKSDPFVVFSLNGSKAYKSQTKKKTLAPEWNETFEVSVPSRVGADFFLEVFDWNQVETAKSLGSGNIELADITPFETTSRTVQLSSQKHGEKGQIQIRMLFRPEIIAKARTKTSTFSSAGRAMTQVGGIPLGAGRSVGRKALGLFGRGDKDGSSEEVIEPPPVPVAAPPAATGNGNANGAANATLGGSVGSATGNVIKPMASPAPGPGTLKVTLHRARDLAGIEEGDVAKPFAILKIGDRDHKSKHVKSNTPEWNETFVFPNTTTDIRTLHVAILDKQTFKKDPILAEGNVDIWRYIQPLFTPPILSAEVTAQLDNNGGTVQLRLEFEPMGASLARTISNSGGSSLAASTKISSPSRFSLGRRPVD